MNNKAATILDIMRRVRALAQNGLAYSEQYFDRERYQELYELSGLSQKLLETVIE
jgi:hypothetical protein